MTAETREYIEHLDSIEDLSSAYFNCPMRIINDFNNTLHVAGIDYPLELHVYIVVCCYISNRFSNVLLKSYDFDYTTEQEKFFFECDNCLYLVEQLTHDLSVILPKRSINANISQQRSFTGITRLIIRIAVH